MIGDAPWKRTIAWVLLALCLLIGFTVFWYNDIWDTLDNSIMLVESIVEGEFFDYYEYAALNSASQTKYSANYNVLLYAVFALWNLPIAIAHIVTGNEYMTDPSVMLWCKLIIVAAYAGIFIVMKKLTEKLGGSRNDGTLAGFLSVSSLCVFAPALIASQYDCIAILFMLLGVYFYTENKTWQFLLMFAIAMPLKLFAIFILVPMLLIRFKNVLKLLGMLAAVMVPSFLLELPFRGDPYYHVAMDSQNGDALELILDATVSVGSLELNLFIIAYIVICFFCYIRRESDPVREGHLAVYFSFAVFGAFCVLIPIRSYWIILYTPFMAILASLKKGSKTVPVLADTLAGLFGGLFILANHWIYNTGNIAGRLVLSGIYTPDGYDQKYGHFKGFLEAHGILDFKYVFFAIFAGTVIFALWYFYPREEIVKEADTRTFGEWAAVVSRPLILIAVALFLIYCENATQPGIKYGSDDYDEAAKIQLMSDETATRIIAFEEDCELSEMSVWLYPKKVNRADRSFIGFTLTDDTTGEVIWKDAVGTAVLVDGMPVKFELDGPLSVTADRTYTLELYGIDPELSNNSKVSPYLDTSGEVAVLFR